MLFKILKHNQSSAVAEAYGRAEMRIAHSCRRCSAGEILEISFAVCQTLQSQIMHNLSCEDGTYLAKCLHILSHCARTIL